MPWECAHCGREEEPSLPISAVCHHCGRPLCRDHRVEIVDDAFAKDTGSHRRAYHCKECQREYHPHAPVLSAPADDR